MAKSKKNPIAAILFVAGIGVGYFINNVTSVDDSVKQNLYKETKFSIDDYEESKHPITLKQAVDMRNNYVKRFKDVITKIQHESVNRERGYQPTEYSFIEIKELKRYLDFLDYIQDQNPNNPKFTGVAIQFGAYNLDKKQVNNKWDFRGRLSVFLTPTLRKDDFEIPVYLNHKGTRNKYKGVYEPLAELYNDKEYSSFQESSSEKLMEASFFSALDFDDFWREQRTSLSSNELATSPPLGNNFE